MGLDMYANKTKAVPENDVDFQTHNFGEEEIHYWRKHPNLHGWMENLYYSKGGNMDSFNCTNLLLTIDDLNQLESDINDRNLPLTSGFFFGTSDDESIEDDLQFVLKAREAISEGYSVYYSSWW
jgi:hypothetical protein